MTFVQIIELETTPDKVDEILASSDEWFQATEGKRTLVREFITKDRNEPNRYMAIVFFDSYESAMENSELPETQRSAKVLESLTTSMSFRDLDVIDERS